MIFCQECNNKIHKHRDSVKFCSNRCYDVDAFRSDNDTKIPSRWMAIGLNSSYEAMLEVYKMFKV